MIVELILKAKFLNVQIVPHMLHFHRKRDQLLIFTNADSQQLAKRDHHFTDILISLQDGQRIDRLQRIVNKMRIDLGDQRLKLKFFLTRLLGLHLLNQFGNLRTHPVEAIDQQIRLVFAADRGRDRYEYPLLHSFHPVHRTDNAAHQAADEKAVEQESRDQRYQNQHDRDVADGVRFRSDQLAWRNGHQVPILVMRRQVGDQRLFALIFGRIVALSFRLVMGQERKFRAFSDMCAGLVEHDIPQLVDE
ncbi:hypothetical protein D3C81_1314410 [compost metagenome]